jgi:hypothetical protein
MCLPEAFVSISTLALNSTVTGVKDIKAVLQEQREQNHI